MGIFRQPPPPFLGGAQPYAPRDLPPSITAVAVNDPPFSHYSRNTFAVVPSQWGWLPPTWPFIFAGGAQPYSAKQLLPPSLLSVDDPPFFHGGRGAARIIDEQWTWLPSAWPFVFAGGQQPYSPSRLHPAVLAIDNPPFVHSGRATSRIIDDQWRWLPESWPYAFSGARQPYAPRWLPPTITAVAVDNPPFGIPNKAASAAIARSWIFPPPLPQLNQRLVIGSYVVSAASAYVTVAGSVYGTTSYIDLMNDPTSQIVYALELYPRSLTERRN